MFVVFFFGVFCFVEGTMSQNAALFLFCSCFFFYFLAAVHNST
jgi:hypothetical protein